MRNKHNKLANTFLLTGFHPKDRISDTYLKGTMKLLDTPIGKTVRIIQYNGGKGVRFKLHQLGLTPGKDIKVLRHAPLGGPLMIDVEGRSLALGRGIAARIKVEMN